MSRTTVSTQTAAALAEVTGIDSAAKVYYGPPQIMPAGGSEYPIAVYHVGQPTYSQITMGPNGKLEAKYIVDITLYLGTPDMRTTDAESIQLQLADAMRYTFYQSYLGTLNGSVLSALLTEGDDNIKTFYGQSEYPSIPYRLEVTEHIAISAAIA